MISDLPAGFKIPSTRHQTHGQIQSRQRFIDNDQRDKKQFHPYSCESNLAKAWIRMAICGLGSTEAFTVLFFLFINQSSLGHDFPGALRAITVGELGIGVLTDVNLQLLPNALLIADLLALSTNGQKGFKNLYLGERPTQRLCYLVLMIEQDPYSGYRPANCKERNKPDQGIPDGIKMGGVCVTSKNVRSEPDSSRKNSKRYCTNESEKPCANRYGQKIENEEIKLVTRQPVDHSQGEHNDDGQ
jgi:hypothetical protein